MKKTIIMIVLTITFLLFGCGSDNEVNSPNIVAHTIEKQETQTVEEVENTVEETEEIESADVTEETLSTEVYVSFDVHTEEVTEQTQEVHEEIAEVTAEEMEEESNEMERSKPHTCTWDGGIVTINATCNSEGIKTFKCSGCGTTRTESIVKTSHNYVTESTPATCTAAGTTKTYCSICGSVQSEDAGEAARGHITGEKKYAFSGPTCTKSAYYNIYCAVCGEVIEVGSDPMLPHTEVATVLVEATCSSIGANSIDCSVCGVHLRDDNIPATGNHNWIATEYDVFNEDTLEWEKIPGEYCTVCNRQR